MTEGAGRGDFRDTLYTVDKSGRRRWVYPRFSPGRIMRVRRVVAWILIAFYLALPWISIGGKQGVLLDIPHRRFVFFGAELFATDTIFLFLALAVLALSLFFFTALLGRVWCGWACPETVFLEFVFRPIERLIEGNESARRRLDEAPWSARKLVKKGMKYLLFGVVAWVLASTALAYFIGREPLLQMMAGSPLDHLTPFLTTVFLMGVLLFQFAWFREQFCTLVCPYARFQSVLMDRQSLLVGYDPKRGEPRGKPRAHKAAGGDCVDCGLCVRVCPTGIDIRNGTQLECIACAACIDACNSVMVGIGKRPGLIRYDTESGLLGLGRTIARPRVFLYGALLSLVVVAFVGIFSTRKLVEIEVLRPQGVAPFVRVPNGTVMNQFAVRLTNHGPIGERFTVGVKDMEGAVIVSPLTNFELNGEAIDQVPLFIQVPEERFEGGQASVTIEINGTRGATLERTLKLMGPVR